MSRNIKKSEPERCVNYFTLRIIIIFMETMKDVYISAQGIVSKRLGSRYRSGRSKDWLKFKNPEAPAVKREGRRIEDMVCVGFRNVLEPRHRSSTLQMVQQAVEHRSIHLLKLS
jgi:hypothetical protein